MLLTHGEETAAAPAGQGGTGQTQIAVAFSQVRWDARGRRTGLGADDQPGRP